MRRLLASLVLAGFVGGPLLQLNCEIVCSGEDAPESAAVSHDRGAASVPSMSTLDDCASHWAVAPMLASSRSVDSHAVTAIEVIDGAEVHRASAIVRTFVVLPPGGPPGSFILPLRV